MDSPKAALNGLLIIALTLLVGCGAFRRGPKADLDALWDFRAADALTFATQEKERGYSALASGEGALYLVSERWGRILKLGFPVSPAGKFEEMALSARQGARYEGAALVGESLYLLDGRTEPSREDPPLIIKVSIHQPDVEVAAYSIGFTQLDCRDGHCLSGIAVAGGALYLLDEQDTLPGGGCAGRLYSMSLQSLEAGGPASPQTVSLPLPSCRWLYSDIHPVAVGERLYLLALKTFCSRAQEDQECDEEEYVVELMSTDAASTVVSSYHFPEPALRWWKMANVSRNLEGVAVGHDGSLYIVSDNRWAGDLRPKSLLIRVPKR